MPNTRLSEQDRALVALLEPRGALGLRVREIAERSNTPLRSARTDLAALEKRGVVEKASRGIYRVARARRSVPVASRSGQRIWRALSENALPAYLSGLDVIGGSSQQFLFGYPHLVISTPESARDVDWALSAAGFAVRPLGSNTMLPHGDRVVLLGQGSDWQHSLYQVREHVAPAELAWLDLLRATQAGNYPISGIQLGQILADLRTDPRFEQRLRTVAKRQPARRLGQVLDSRRAPGDPVLREVAEGLSG